MTTPYFFIEEHQILSVLFEEGLDLLHIRKPDTEPVYSERLLTLLPDAFRRKIVVHDHFYLKNEFNLKGIHLNNRNINIPDNYKGHLSCTLSDAEEIKSKKKHFDYLFYGQIYASLSENGKSDWAINPAALKEAAKAGVIDKKVFAMGNVGLDNIRELKDLGFGGVVVMADLWNKFNIHATQDYKELINHFRKLKKAALY